MKYKMIDLFAGIGGFRLGLEQTERFQTVFSCEIDKFACKTYETNFHENPYGDIRQVEADSLPDFDVLAGGFPCQAFSISGKKEGFDDSRGRGNLFFEIARLTESKRPKILFLENVRGLTIHDKGRTFSIILQILEDLGYKVYHQILDAQDFSLAQKRKRIFIVAIREDIHHSPFVFPDTLPEKVTFKDVKEANEVDNRFYLSEKTLLSLKRHRDRHQSKGNGFGYEIIGDNDLANTLMVGGMGREKNLVYDDRLTNFIPTTNKRSEINREGIRYMTPREWARLQGFPDDFSIPVSPTQAYRQFGNSVPVKVIHQIAMKIVDYLDQINP